MAIRMMPAPSRHAGHARQFAIELAKAGRPDAIEDLALRMEPALARAFLAWFDSIRDTIVLARLIEALRAGDVDAAVAAAGFPADPGPLPADAQSRIREIISAAAAVAATSIPAGRTPTGLVMEVRFDVLNPRTADFVRNYEFNLIKQVTDASREAVRGVVQRGLTAGQNPRTLARDVRDIVGLTKRQELAVSNFERELRTFHTRTSAKAWNLGGQISRAPGGAQVFAIDAKGNPIDRILERRLRDFRFDGVLARAMETGKPLTEEQIERMVAAYRRKYLRFRSEMIARSEALRAANAGALEQWRQAGEAGIIDPNLVRRKWLTAKDERTCPVCQPIPDMNKWGVGLNETFRTPAGPMLLPPIHPDCRCTVLYRRYEPEQIAEMDRERAAAT